MTGSRRFSAGCLFFVPFELRPLRIGPPQTIPGGRCRPTDHEGYLATENR